jgi:hypothetical protein
MSTYSIYIGDFEIVIETGKIRQALARCGRALLALLLVRS